MFTAEQYRAKAREYANLIGTANGANEMHEFQKLERSFTELADNAQWVTDNHDKIVPPCAEHTAAEATQAQNGGLVFQTLHPPRVSLSLPGGPVITSKAGYDDV